MGKSRKPSIVRAAIACMALATGTSAAAQFRPLTVPSARPAPVAKEALAANFTLGQAQCARDFSRATVPVTARVMLPSTMASKTKLTYAVHVDGATTGTVTTNARRGADGRPYFDVSRTLSLRTGSAETALRLYVDGQPFGGVETVATPCRLRGVQDRRTAAAADYPDLAIGPIVIAEYSPPQPVERPSWNLFAPTLSLGRAFGFGPNALFETDFRRTLALWRQTSSSCPSESDAFVTMTFWVSLVADGTSAETYFRNESQRYFELYSDERILEADAGYFDSRGGSPVPEPGDRALPEGYEWAVFDRVLPCTRNGIFEFQIDRDNRLRESDETNNTVRLRYSTVPPE